jgi:S1-C subfamily serine protease
VCERGFALIDTQSNFIEPLGVLAFAAAGVSESGVQTPGTRGGVLVASPINTPRASTVDLLKGDVIRTVNGIIVNNPLELREAIARIGHGSPVVLRVERYGRLTYVAFEQP